MKIKPSLLIPVGLHPKFFKVGNNSLNIPDSRSLSLKGVNPYSPMILFFCLKVFNEGICFQETITLIWVFKVFGGKGVRVWV